MGRDRALFVGFLVLAACSGSSGGTAPTDGGGKAPGEGHDAQAPADAGGTKRSGAHDGAVPSREGGSVIGGADASADAPSGEAGPVCGTFQTDYDNGNGSVTYYTFGNGDGVAVNCGFNVTGQGPDSVAWVETGNGEYFGAMNTADYDNAAVCGACVEVTRDGTRKVDITVVDQCPTDTNPKCTAGHIDLSEQAFLQIGSASEGYLGTGNGAAVGVISWKYIPCPTTKDVVFQVKPGSTQYYAPILVEGHRYPIVSVDVMMSGAWQPATRQSYNYWIVGGGALGTGPFDVRATDVNGSVVTATLQLDPGTDQLSSEQFPLCH